MSMNKPMMVVACVAFAAAVLPAAAFETAYDGLLWTNGAPGQITGAAAPLMRVYVPDKRPAGSAAVIICPGGGYGGLCAVYEGEDIAKDLTRRGIAGVVLRYRVAPHRHPAPLTDARRCLRLVQEHAAAWGIDPKRIGVLGFSAGGHLAATLSTHNAKEIAFSALVYPVISMQDGFTHGGSRRNLLGEKPDPAAVLDLSNDLLVNADTPPAFVVHSTTDSVVPVENSRRYVAALRRFNRPVRYLELESGDHGLGCGKGTEWAQWYGAFGEWLDQCGYSRKPGGWRNGSDRVIRGTELYGASATTNVEGHLLVDFGLHNFGWLEVEDRVPGEYEFVWGELARDGKVVRGQRGSTLRWARTVGKLAGKGGFVKVPYAGGKGGGDFWAGAVDGRLGTVMPFRWLEIVKAPYAMDLKNVRQVPFYYPFDMSESRFACDDARLNKVYDFCKHSIRATSFLGYFIDGDRERTAYEADAYINGLSAFAISTDPAPHLRTLYQLQWNPTWPTEWKQFFIRCVYEYWMHTGDTKAVFERYQMMKHTKSWRHLRRADGLVVSAGPGLMPAADGAAPQDLVDWPPSFRDGFEMGNVKSVVNALHYRNLRELAEMAAAIGQDADAKLFAAEAEATYAAFQKVFYNEELGAYVDCEGSKHATVQGNAMAIACGVVPAANLKRVGDYVAKKGFTCTTYMAQFVLEALFLSGHAERAFELMTADGERSWLNMMKQGATITLELWDVTDKQFGIDMNHAWSTAPLNTITRYVLGVKPTKPGFAAADVKPNFGPLKRVSAQVPTLKGVIAIDWSDGKLTVRKPQGME